MHQSVSHECGRLCVVLCSDEYDGNKYRAQSICFMQVCCYFYANFPTKMCSVVLIRPLTTPGTIRPGVKPYQTSSNDRGDDNEHLLRPSSRGTSSVYTRPGSTSTRSGDETFKIVRPLSAARAGRDVTAHLSPFRPLSAGAQPPSSLERPTTSDGRSSRFTGWLGSGIIQQEIESIEDEAGEGSPDPVRVPSILLKVLNLHLSYCRVLVICV